MKKIDLSNISTGVGMPIKSGVLSHLQSAYQEVIDAIVKGNIGGGYDPTKYYVLYGCVNSTTAPIYTVSAGAIFFNGEIYLVDAFTFTATGSNVAVGTITTSFFSGTNADPITFTDGIARNVLQIRKIVFAAAASASSDVDFSGLIYQSSTEFELLSLINSFEEVENIALEPISPLRIKKIGAKTVHITGLITGNIYVSGVQKIVCNLPLKYRPTTYIAISFPVTYTSSSVNYPSSGTILLNGDLLIEPHIYSGTITCSSITINATYEID
jgi:hypothetical protein